MKSGKRRSKITALLAAVCILLLVPLRVFAAEGDPIEQRTDCVISLAYKDRNGRPITGMRVRLFHVAHVTGKIMQNAVSGYDIDYTLTEEFKQFDEVTGSTRVAGFSEKGINEALKIKDGETSAQRRQRWLDIASTLRYYAVTDVTPTKDSATLDDGTIRFTGLETGLYLLVVDDTVVEETGASVRYRYLPTFVTLPQYDNGTWNYGSDLDYSEDNPTLRAKYSYHVVERSYDYEIYKRWANDTAVVRPESVRVDLYRDNAFYQTIYLNEANNWTYQWTSRGQHSWYAIERTISPGYAVTIATTGTAMTFTNTYTPPPETPPPPVEPPPPGDPGDVPPVFAGEVPDVLGARRMLLGTDEPQVLGARRLPRTGQLWWPVPVLACTGLLLFTAGYVRHRN